MFTGLIEGKGRIHFMQRSGGDMRMTISPLFPMDDCTLGESISVNGVCLTVTATGADGFSVDVSRETLSRSTLGLLKEQEEVNLERAREQLRLAEVGFREGVRKQVEVLDARAALTEARKNYSQAVFSHMVARLNLERATGALSAAAGNQGDDE